MTELIYLNIILIVWLAANLVLLIIVAIHHFRLDKKQKQLERQLKVFCNRSTECSHAIKNTSDAFEAVGKAILSLTSQAKWKL